MLASAAPQAVVSAMGRHMADARLQEEACFALVQLAWGGGAKGKRAAIDAGATLSPNHNPNPNPNPNPDLTLTQVLARTKPYPNLNPIPDPSPHPHPDPDPKCPTLARRDGGARARARDAHGGQAPSAAADGARHPRRAREGALIDGGADGDARDT